MGVIDIMMGVVETTRKNVYDGGAENDEPRNRRECVVRRKVPLNHRRLNSRVPGRVLGL